LQDFNERTNLESLVFEECNIDGDALKMIMKIPKALKRLTLGERVHHFHEPTSGYLPEESGGKLVEALALQAHSLEYLKQTQESSTKVLRKWYHYTSSERRRVFALPHELQDFPALKEIDIPYGSPLTSLIAKLQPQLKKIRLTQVHEYVILGPGELLNVLPRELRIMDQPTVNHLELVLNEEKTPRGDTQAEWLAELLGPDSHVNPWSLDESRTSVWEFGRRLGGRDIRLTFKWIRSAGFIPPFMHGEIVPTEFTIYDSKLPDIFGCYDLNEWFRDKECARRAKEGGIYRGAHGIASEEEEKEDEDVVYDHEIP
jgi:hypothetical protein